MREIAEVFLKLGLFGFGGPIAAIALMEQEISRRRAWISTREFAKAYALCKLLPGPVATQLAIHLGFVRGGRWGGLVAGVLFIFPAFVMVLALGALYSTTDLQASSGSFLLGLQAGALALIVHSMAQLGRPYASKPLSWIIATASAVVTVLNPGMEPIAILAAGLLGVFRVNSKVKTSLFLILASAFTVIAWASPAWIPAHAKDWSDIGPWLEFFWVFFKAGAFVFGSGLAIVPLLEGDIVDRLGWITHQQFIDALVVGQITPGPVVISATFIGYQVAGFLGACVATVTVFLPGFFNVLVLIPRFWPRFQHTEKAEAFANFAIPAVVGGIAGSTARLSLLAFHTTPSRMIFASLLALYCFPFVREKIPAWGLIALGGALGALCIS